MKRLKRGFFDRPADIVARELLGRYLVHERQESVHIGRIVETEAYLGPHDLASHSCRKKTPRTAVMFGPPGFAYVYLIYGIHHLINVVTGPGENPSAVLLRALEPVRNIYDKTRGPGLVCRAMHIDRQMNGSDVTVGSLYFAADSTGPEGFEITEKPRIGVDYAGTWAKKPLRFYIRDNPFISRK